jgi:hypothetical protein
MDNETDILKAEILRLYRRLAAYETAVKRLPDLCEQLANELEETPAQKEM